MVSRRKNACSETLCFPDVAEGGIRVKLRLVETAGFGDQLDKDKR